MVEYKVHALGTKKALISVWLMLALSMASTSLAGSGEGPLLPVQKDGLYGYVDSSGEIRLPAQYRQASRFSEGLAFVVTDKGGTYIDTEGRAVAEPDQTWLVGTPIRSGLGVVLRQASPRAYVLVYAAEQEIRISDVGEARVVLPGDGYAVFMREGMWGVMDPDGEAVLGPMETGAMRPVSEGMLLFSEPSKVVLERDERTRYRGYMDLAGTEILSPQYTAGRGFREGLAPVSKGDGWYYINKHGHDVFGRRFDDAYEFREGMARVVADVGGERRFGYLSRDGRLQVEPTFVQARDFSSGLAAVRIADDDEDGRWGYIDHAGSVVIEPAFSSAGEFHGDVAKVATDEFQGVINRQGDWVWRHPGRGP